MLKEVKLKKLLALCEFIISSQGIPDADQSHNREYYEEKQRAEHNQNF
jgi:hypothetical protein